MEERDDRHGPRCEVQVSQHPFGQAIRISVRVVGAPTRSYLRTVGPKVGIASLLGEPGLSWPFRLCSKVLGHCVTYFGVLVRVMGTTMTVSRASSKGFWTLGTLSFKGSGPFRLLLHQSAEIKEALRNTFSPSPPSTQVVGP